MAVGKTTQDSKRNVQTLLLQGHPPHVENKNKLSPELLVRPPRPLIWPETSGKLICLVSKLIVQPQESGLRAKSMSLKCLRSQVPGQQNTQTLHIQCPWCPRDNGLNTDQNIVFTAEIPWGQKQEPRSAIAPGSRPVKNRTRLTALRWGDKQWVPSSGGTERHQGMLIQTMRKRDGLVLGGMSMRKRDQGAEHQKWPWSLRLQTCCCSAFRARAATAEEIPSHPSSFVWWQKETETDGAPVAVSPKRVTELHVYLLQRRMPGAFL